MLIFSTLAITLASRYFTFCFHVPRKTHDISSLYPRKICAKKSRDFRNSTLLSVTDHNISLCVLYGQVKTIS